MRFTPLSPARLVVELAEWVLRTATDPAVRSRRPHQGELASVGTVIGVDGATEVGATTLADDVADALRSSGLPIIRAGTAWWWRPSALRLEFGRQDENMLLSGWVDADAIRRELIDPVLAGGRPYITRLRDPLSDRSIRQRPETALSNSILVVDGPFLLAAGLPLDGLVGLRVGRGALVRALPADRGWWIPAFGRYDQEFRAADRADVLISYDHASSPAVSGLDVGRFT